MKDKERLQELLLSFGVAFKTFECGFPPPTTRIAIEKDYPGFYMVFVFDKDGKFVEMGAYE